MRFNIALVLAILLVFSFSAFAQSGTAYVGYQYTNIDTNGATDRLNMNGWETGSSINLNKTFAAEGLVAGAYRSNAFTTGELGVKTNLSVYSYVFGPRVNLGRYAFAHFLMGGAHLTASASASGRSGSTSQNSFAMSIGGGTQIKIAPHFAVRTTFDYVPTYFVSNTQNNVRIGVGLAYLFGQPRGARK